MDRLPKHNELIFERLRKTLYLRLTTVIRSLSTKFDDDTGSVQILECAIRIAAPANALQTRFTRNDDRLFCILAEIRYVHLLYQIFIFISSGDRRRTKKLEAGIARLEWLRDNWDDLEVTGDLKSGYRLELGYDSNL